MLCLPYLLFNRKVRSPLAIVISETEGLGTNISSGEVEKGKGVEDDSQDHLTNILHFLIYVGVLYREERCPECPILEKY